MARIQTVPLDIPNEYYSAIGAVLAKWALLEWQVQNVIWSSIGIGPKEGRTLTIGMHSQTLTAILRNLPRKWITDASLNKEVIALADGMKALVPSRNYLAHGIWAYDENDPKQKLHLQFMKEGKHRILPGSEPWEPQHLRLIAANIRVFNKAAHRINVRIQNQRAGLQEQS